MMARVIFNNLSKEQALTLANWFEGQGEQDALMFDKKGKLVRMSY